MSYANEIAFTFGYPIQARVLVLALGLGLGLGAGLYQGFVPRLFKQALEKEREA